MISFATELVTPSVTDERTLRMDTLPRLVYKRLTRLMFSENNITTNYLRDLAHCNTLLIDLTQWEHLQILGER